MRFFVGGFPRSRGDSVAFKGRSWYQSMLNPGSSQPLLEDGEFILGDAGFALAPFLVRCSSGMGGDVSQCRGGGGGPATLGVGGRGGVERWGKRGRRGGVGGGEGGEWREGRVRGEGPSKGRLLRAPCARVVGRPLCFGDQWILTATSLQVHWVAAVSLPARNACHALYACLLCPPPPPFPSL